MSRCRVCSHKKRSAIDRTLVSLWRRSGTMRDTARRYGLSKSSLHRHFFEHIPAALWESENARKRLGSDNLLSLLTEEANEVRKLRQAATAALTDPSHPDRLTLDPNPDQISVTYVAMNSEGAPVKQRELLSVILRRFAKRGKAAVVSWTITRTDPGAQLVASARAFADFGNLIARIRGELKDVLLLEDTRRIEVLAQALMALIPTKDLPRARRLLEEEADREGEAWN